MKNKKEWFEEWFDSPYYHILYGDRDMQEAEFFLQNLISKFVPGDESKIIDLACGKGRHSIYLNSLGFDVTGVDLSEQSIAQAKCFENDRLRFEVGDLRRLELNDKYDIALNLFTSFAYFEDLKTDERVLLQIKQILKPGGFLLIDFFNAVKVVNSLIAHEIKEKDGIRFHICKKLDQGKIIKNIVFQDAGKDFEFEEKVQALLLSDFENLLDPCGFKLMDTFGSYDLCPFDPENSDRLIILAQSKYAG